MWKKTYLKANRSSTKQVGTLKKSLYLCFGVLVCNLFFSGMLSASSTDKIKESKAAQIVEAYSLECFAGQKVESKPEQWSPYSVCPKDSSVTGLHRIDLHGPHNLPNIHVNDFTCTNSGCKAWCIGASCTVISQCCRVVIKK